MRPYVVLDTERATSRGAPHLLEIGAVRIVDGDAAEEFVALVRPEVPIDPEATDFHGIDDATVRDARTASEVVADFVRFAGADVLVAHDAAKDALVLGFEAARHGIELPENELIDTLRLSRLLVPETSDHKLDTLARHLEIDADVHHRALADAVTCWKVLEACVARLRDVEDGANGADVLRELRARAGLRATLARSGPRRPRIRQRLRPLETACRERGRVTLVYGEHEPGARVELAPRILFAMGEHGYLEAECVRSGTIKTYRLDRVQRVLPA